MSKNISNIEPISLMEPMIPEESIVVLNNLAVDLIEKAHELSGKINRVVQGSISHLVRSMNCYYSNFIEGHQTYPRDIERALVQDFSTNSEKRNLQLEAKAHIEVQKMVDESEVPSHLTSENYICWLHKEFCSRLPKTLMWVEDPDTKKRVEVIPGKLRTESVIVGQHFPPLAQNIPRFLEKFEKAYDPQNLSKLRRVLAVAASHHRLLWIHPFFDGNGRVTRLFSHVYLKFIGLGTGLWSVSRGLARTVNEYRACLQNADSPRLGDLDGRGNLSTQGLVDFCRYFLKACLDQVQYMGSLLEPDEFLGRVKRYCSEEEERGRLPKKSFYLLREAWLMGEFERGEAGIITNYSQRQASTVLNELVKKELLISNTPKGKVRLNFPLSVVERWFPNLYPSSVL